MDAGAEFAITQPVFDAAQLEKFFERVGGQHIPVIAGIWPLVSVRNAEFLANEVPGVSVPEAVIARMRRANEKSKEHAVAEGIAVAREMFERVRPLVQGVQVSAPFGKVELALQRIRLSAARSVLFVRPLRTSDRLPWFAASGAQVAERRSLDRHGGLSDPKLLLATTFRSCAAAPHGKICRSSRARRPRRCGDFSIQMNRCAR